MARSRNKGCYSKYTKYFIRAYRGKFIGSIEFSDFINVDTSTLKKRYYIKILYKTIRYKIENTFSHYRVDPIPWTDFSRSNDGPLKKFSSSIIHPTEATLSDQNEMIDPIVLNTIPPVRTTFASPSGIVSLETRTTELDSLISPVTITGATDGNANIVTIESNDEIASDDTSKKLFLCGSLRNELIVSRPGSGSVFIKGELAKLLRILNEILVSF